MNSRIQHLSNAQNPRPNRYLQHKACWFPPTITSFLKREATSESRREGTLKTNVNPTSQQGSQVWEIALLHPTRAACTARSHVHTRHNIEWSSAEQHHSAHGRSSIDITEHTVGLVLTSQYAQYWMTRQRESRRSAAMNDQATRIEHGGIDSSVEWEAARTKPQDLTASCCLVEFAECSCSTASSRSACTAWSASLNSWNIQSACNGTAGLYL